MRRSTSYLIRNTQYFGDLLTKHLFPLRCSRCFIPFDQHGVPFPSASALPAATPPVVARQPAAAPKVSSPARARAGILVLKEGRRRLYAGNPSSEDLRLRAKWLKKF